MLIGDWLAAQLIVRLSPTFVRVPVIDIGAATSVKLVLG
jgi:hypothetical protein